MTAKTSYLTSTIGQKQVVALSGLSLSLFVLAHMMGNLLIFVSPQAYNMYGHALVSTPLIYVAEAGLVLFFALHVFLAIRLTWLNRGARPQAYAVSAKGEKATHFVQKTLLAQGLVILVFVILHLITFKYGKVYWVTYDGVTVRDLHRLIIEVFSQPGYLTWYLVALVVLGLHLSHGVSSALQTFGAAHPQLTPLLKKIGLGYALIVSLGFISLPIYVYFIY